MLLRETYSTFPGHCRLCTSSGTPVIDTERPYDSDGYGGALYVCYDCVTTMANLCGFVHPERHEDLEREHETTCQRLDEQETENADLAAQLETLKEAMNLAAPTAPAVKRGPGRPRKVTDA